MGVVGDPRKIGSLAQIRQCNLRLRLRAWDVKVRLEVQGLRTCKDAQANLETTTQP